MDRDTIIEILRRVRYRDWTFEVGQLDGSFWIQVRFSAPGTDDGVPRTQHGRKWLVSRHAVPSEVIRTAWLAVSTAIEHEAREEFRFDGRPIFGPHIDCEQLKQVAGHHDRRASRVR